MKKLIAAVVLAGVVVSGCAGGGAYEPYTPGWDPLPTAKYPNITAEGHIAGYLAANTPTITKDPILSISVPVRLMSDKGQWSKVQYRYIFLDSNFAPVRAQPDWQPMTMEPRQQVFMTGNALDTNAVNWRLEIRPQR